MFNHIFKAIQEKESSEGSKALLEEDRYDLPDDENPDDDTTATSDDEGSDDTTPTTSDEDDTDTGDETGESEDDGGDDGAEPSGEDGEPTTSDSDTNYDMDGDDAGGDATGSEDTNTSTTTDPEPKVGEVLNLTDLQRAVLQYRNYSKFRDLRDVVESRQAEIMTTPTSNEVQRELLDKAVGYYKDLMTKLDDYASFKYSNTSYEMNFKNYNDFILEKRSIDELVDKALSYEE